MNKQVLFTIIENTPIAKDVYKLVLIGDNSALTAPGQFVNIKLDDGLNAYLRRPISVCDYEGGKLTLLYKVFGKGTALLAKKRIGERLDLLMGLGNGFDVNVLEQEQTILLVGGGVGVPPLYNLAKVLKDMGKTVKVILGFNDKDDVFYEDEFNKITDEVYVATANGSYGEQGFVTDVIKNNNLQFDYYMTCGPEPMLNALLDTIDVSGQLSFEERMGCGFGACMGCSCKTKFGYKRICVEGPVLKAEEVLRNE